MLTRICDVCGGSAADTPSQRSAVVRFTAAVPVIVIFQAIPDQGADETHDLCQECANQAIWHGIAEILMEPRHKKQREQVEGMLQEFDKTQPPPFRVVCECKLHDAHECLLEKCEAYGGEPMAAMERCYCKCHLRGIL